MENFIETLTHSSKFWILLYLSYLLITNTIFSIAHIWFYVIVIVGVGAIALGLENFRLKKPPEEIIQEVLGSNIYQNVKTGDFSSIPQTSRLASVANSTQNLANEGKPYVMWIVGHRGAGLDAPENSLSAFRACKARGCNAVEFDIAITKDNIPIVFHDDDLARVAGIEKDIRDMTYDELSRVDIATKHPLSGKFVGERIPTFDEAVKTCLDLDLRFFIDLKDCDLRMADVVLNAFQKYGEQMYKRAVVSSFYPSVIYQIRRKDPRIIGSMAWRPAYHRYKTWDGSWENLTPRNTGFFATAYAIVLDFCLEYAIRSFLPWFLGLSVVLLNKDAITREGIARWLKSGLRVFAWTVNNPLEKLHLTQNFNIGHLTDTLDGGDLVHMTPSNPRLAAEFLSKKMSRNGLTSIPSEMFTTPVTSEATLDRAEKELPHHRNGVVAH